MAVILIVEDDFLICEMAKLMIEGMNHHALVASDFEQAMELLRSPQQIDVLFTDIYLKSEMYGGCEVATQAAALRPGLRVLYTTGNTVTDGLRDRLNPGSDCLRKPYTERELKAAIEHLLAA